MMLSRIKQALLEPLFIVSDLSWPTTWFVPRLTGQGPFGDTYSVMNNWGANHCVMSCGHIGADLISLANSLPKSSGQSGLVMRT